MKHHTQLLSVTESIASSLGYQYTNVGLPWHHSSVGSQTSGGESQMQDTPMYANLETLTEPHKLTAAMQCVVAVARPMVQGKTNGYKEGPTHVIPLLLATLPGIDPNDIRKCFVTLQFISTFATMIPFVDSSTASENWKDLTEEEEIICLATADFEDFVLQFMDRCFILIENSSLEATRLEQEEGDKRSKIENMAECALSSSCTALLVQTSPDIFKVKRTLI
uniref:Proteasome activator Blm10 middle HEAT repeats region domain-containing protein n=1 Tax=Timema douglasi TaxID=61478 RepID=A0A7R8Z983_TIMDO|nr:unnamed protein product [Timema douglasi]